MTRLFLTLVPVVLACASTVGLAGVNNPPAAAEPQYCAYVQCDDATKTLVRKSIAGMGGEAALAKISGIAKRATIEQTTPQGKLTTNFTGIALFPDSLYAKMTLPGGEEITAVSCPRSAHITRASSQIRGSALRMTEEEKTVLTRYFYEDPLLVVKNRIDPSYLFGRGGNATVNGRQTEILFVRVPRFEVQWFIDSESGRVVRTVSGAKRSDFDDFRDVGGVTLPFRVATVDGETPGKVTCHGWELNPVVETAKIFAQPTIWLARNSLPFTQVDSYNNSMTSYYDPYSWASQSSSWGSYIFYLYYVEWGE